MEWVKSLTGVVAAIWLLLYTWSFTNWKERTLHEMEDLKERLVDLRIELAKMDGVHTEGTWSIQNGSLATCSNCGWHFEDVWSLDDHYDRYCRHCGAKMFLEDEYC